MIISWSSYLIQSLTIVGLYYIALVLLFYRKDLRLPVRQVNVKGGESDSPLFFPQKELINQHPAGEGVRLDAASAAPMHSLVDELQAFFTQVSEQEISRDLLLVSLKNIMGKYPSVKGSSSEEGIIQLIVSHAENNCSVVLSEAELEELWNND